MGEVSDEENEVKESSRWECLSCFFFLNELRKPPPHGDPSSCYSRRRRAEGQESSTRETNTYIATRPVRVA